MDEFRKRLGRNIRMARKAKGWNQDDLAQQIGVTRNTLCHYETAKRMPNVYMMSLISTAFGMSIDSLVPHVSFQDVHENPDQMTVFDFIGDE